MNYTREQAQAALEWADAGRQIRETDLAHADILAAMVRDLQEALDMYADDGLPRFDGSIAREALHRTGYGEEA